MFVFDFCQTLVPQFAGNTDRHRATDRFNDSRSATLFPVFWVRMPVVPVRGDITHGAATHLSGSCAADDRSLDGQDSAAARATNKLMGREKHRVDGGVWPVHIDGQIGRARRVVPDRDGAVTFEYLSDARHIRLNTRDIRCRREAAHNQGSRRVFFERSDQVLLINIAVFVKRYSDHVYLRFSPGQLIGVMLVRANEHQGLFSFVWV